MDFLAAAHPTQTFYFFSPYCGPLCRTVAARLAQSWPGFSFVFIGYRELEADETLDIQVFAGEHHGIYRQTTRELLAALRRKTLVHLLAETPALSIPAELAVVFMPGWFGWLQTEEEILWFELQRLLDPSRPAPSFHPSREEQDGKVFRYGDLQDFDDLLSFFSCIETFSYDTMVRSFRNFGRILL